MTTDHTTAPAAEDAAAAIEDTGNKSGFVSKIGNVFMHGAEKQAEIAAKKGVAVSELKFFDRLGKVKTGAIAGGAIILGSVIAGMGNKGPGKHAEEAASRDTSAQPSMA